MEPIHLHHTKKNPLIIPALLADRRGLFEKRGLKVYLDLAEDFTFDGNKPFIEGKSDVMMGDLTFFFYILVRHTVWKIYRQNDLKDIVPDAKIVWMNNSYERMQALEKGEIDALVAIEPFVTDLTEKGHHIIWSTRNSDKNLVMWAFGQTFYEKHRESVQAFHSALEEAGKLFNALESKEKIKVCHEELGYPLAFAERMANFEFENQAPIRLEDFNLCMEWMYRENEITRLYDGKELIKQSLC